MGINQQVAESEFKYLNELTLARIRDANYFWITSMVLLSGVCVLAEKMARWYIVIPGLFSILPMCYALAWNLEAIARSRTYISCILEPVLGGSWEKAWSSHPLLREKKIFAPEIVPIIFISMYSTMMIYMNMIALNFWKNGDIMFILVAIPMNSPALLGCIVLYNSFSRKTWKKYIEGWVSE